MRNAGPSESPDENQESTNKPSSNLVADTAKGWGKGSTSFLSRLSMRTTWKRDDDVRDSDSDTGEVRDDGANARALTTVVGAGGGYIPFFKEPPRYIRVHARSKKTKEFNHLFLAQELSIGRKTAVDAQEAAATPTGGKPLKGSNAIWSAEFSVDGKYLAVAGQDMKVHVFAVISTAEDRKAHEEDEARSAGNGEMLSAPVFKTKPIAEFQGHTGEILALSWSKNNFLLSSSMDKTVKLWHLSRPECLCTFKHGDLVTSIAFHPTDDRFFLAGSLDSELRLWSIPDKSIAFSATVTEFITAVAFTPDGKTAICGLFNGMCMFYETNGFKALTQIHVRSSRGKNAKGSKITGIRTATVGEDTKILISSNDSRIRLYSLNTKTLDIKFRGHECQGSQIHARFSEDARHIISGSEDGKTYIWGSTDASGENKDKPPYEYFDAHSQAVTVAVTAPTASKQLLSLTGDPIYDLCNPPPVTLMSLDESQATFSDGYQSERNSLVGKKTEESPAYIERSKHHDGSILVTTDRLGNIKVFRQDCAFEKRQQNMWETGSKFSGKLAGVGRSSSIRTKASTGSRVQSRRGSLSLVHSPPQPASDRIASWRQEVELRPGRAGTPTRSERSISPSKSAVNLASEARRQPYSTGSLGRNSLPSSPGPGNRSRGNSTKLMKERSRENGLEDMPALPPTPSFSIRPLDANDGSFWNRWRSGSRLTASSSHSALRSEGGSETGLAEAARLYPRDRRSARLSQRSMISVRDEDEGEALEQASSGRKRVDSGLGSIGGSTDDTAEGAH